MGRKKQTQTMESEPEYKEVGPQPDEQDVQRNPDREEPERSETKRPSDLAKQDAYDKVLGKLRDMGHMTGTLAWQKLWDFIRIEIGFHTVAIFDPECTAREVMQHRQTVLAYNRLIEFVSVPLEELKTIEEAAAKEPLFPFKRKADVEFDEEKGVLEVWDVS